jgi:nitrate reductase beta subunit
MSGHPAKALNMPGLTTSKPSRALDIPKNGKTRKNGMAAGTPCQRQDSSQARKPLAHSGQYFRQSELAEIDDYYEPFTFDYDHLQKAPEMKTMPTARPRSLVTGERMEKINGARTGKKFWARNSSTAKKDYNFKDIEKEMYGEFENTFMMYLPRLCEHCLNPTCVASCPSGSIYKREEDGIVLVDQDKCRGWRMCISGCPYKKIYYNWNTGKAEKCTFCYPRIENGEPTVCSETCVGRIRYLGVILYDADRIEEAASCENEEDLYEAMCAFSWIRTIRK